MALQRLSDNYGAFVAHLSALAQDTGTRSDDLACLQGYLGKMRQWRMLLGAALYVDLLKPVQLLTLCLQEEKINIIDGIHYFT